MKKNLLHQSGTMGRYQTEQKAKTQARKNAPHLSYGQELDIIRYKDGSFDWIVNYGPFSLPEGSVKVAFCSRVKKTWTRVEFVPSFITEI